MTPEEVSREELSSEEAFKDEVLRHEQPEVAAGESAPPESIPAPAFASPPFGTPTFGAPEPTVPPDAPRFNPAQWVVGLLVLALVGYPLVRWAMNRSAAPAETVAAQPALSPSAQAMLNQSFSLYQAGKYQEAISVGVALVKDNPNSADGWNNLSASYAKLGQWDNAIQSAQQALRIEPGHQLAKGNLAYAQGAKANGTPPPVQGAPTLQELLNLSVDDFRAGKFPECIDDAGKALKLDPKSSQAYNNRGACYGSLGMFEEEIVAEQQAVRLSPDNQLAKNNLAWATQQKQIRDSVRDKKPDSVPGNK